MRLRGTLVLVMQLRFSSPPNSFDSDLQMSKHISQFLLIYATFYNDCWCYSRPRPQVWMLSYFHTARSGALNPHPSTVLSRQTSVSPSMKTLSRPCNGDFCVFKAQMRNKNKLMWFYHEMLQYNQTKVSASCYTYSIFIVPTLARSIPSFLQFLRCTLQTFKNSHHSTSLIIVQQTDGLQWQKKPWGWASRTKARQIRMKSQSPQKCAPAAILWVCTSPHIQGHTTIWGKKRNISK